MKKSLIIIFPIILSILLAAGCGKKEEAAKGAGSAPAVVAAQTPKIVIAAAAALKIETPFQIGSDPQATGGKYVGAPKAADAAGKNKACTAVYEFTAPKAGTYYLWIRKKWAGGCENSLFVKLDDQNEFIFGEDGTYERWDWLTAMARSFELKEGKHALVVKNREDESKFDQILFIADKDYVPQGIEEK
jgi:hypothetical protein